jgi:8-oxo-dGTP pyrophosphatase MutT (NUDIX family)
VAVAVAQQPGILARGPWRPQEVRVSWQREPWQAPPEAERSADAAIAALRERGSPCHDGLAARLAGWESGPGGLALELQPSRWALRLIEGTGGAHSLAALCVVRSEDGRWLAGRRAAWLATWASRWALGAGGAVEVGESPLDTLVRELREEWRLAPVELSVEALVLLPSGLAMVVGLATVAAGADPVPDAEHDEFAWWPADVRRWPEAADERLRGMGALLAEGGGV